MSIQSRRSNQQLRIRHWRYSLPEATPLVAGDVIANLALFTLLRRRAAWSLAGLITQRLEVRILPPRPLSWGKTLNCTLVLLAVDRSTEKTRLFHISGIYSLVICSATVHKAVVLSAGSLAVRLTAQDSCHPFNRWNVWICLKRKTCQFHVSGNYSSPPNSLSLRLLRGTTRKSEESAERQRV